MHQCVQRLMSMLKYLSVLWIYITYFRQYSRRLDSQLVIFFSVLWIDIAYYNQYSRRLTARGHRDGSVVVTHVDVKNNGVYVLGYLKKQLLNSTLKRNKFFNTWKFWVQMNQVLKRLTLSVSICTDAFRFFYNSKSY